MNFRQITSENFESNENVVTEVREKKSKVFKRFELFFGQYDDESYSSSDNGYIVRLKKFARSKMLNKRSQPKKDVKKIIVTKPKSIIIVYGNKVQILIRTYGRFFYARTKSHPKWLAVSSSVEHLINATIFKLEKLFEKSATNCNFQEFNRITGLNIVSPVKVFQASEIEEFGDVSTVRLNR
jgi:hypothetical protein